MEQRSKRNEEKRHVAMHTKGRALLSGIYSAPTAAGG